MSGHSTIQIMATLNLFDWQSFFGCLFDAIGILRNQLTRELKLKGQKSRKVSSASRSELVGKGHAEAVLRLSRKKGGVPRIRIP